MKYFGQPISVTCSVYGNVNDEEDVPAASVPKGRAFLLQVKNDVHMNQNLEKKFYHDWTLSGYCQEGANVLATCSCFSEPNPLRQLYCLFVGCFTSQQHASVSQGRVCSDNLTCCHSEIEVADQTFRLTQSQYTDTGLTSPSDDPITPGAWQGSHWSANF